MSRHGSNEGPGDDDKQRVMRNIDAVDGNTESRAKRRNQSEAPPSPSRVPTPEMPQRHDPQSHRDRIRMNMNGTYPGLF